MFIGIVNTLLIVNVVIVAIAVIVTIIASVFTTVTAGIVEIFVLSSLL